MHLSWPQRLWWKSIEVWDEFKSCRLSLIALAATYFFFLFFYQGAEVLRVLGEGSAGSTSYWFQVVSFFGALALMAISNWYTARALFYFDFPGVRRRVPATGAWDNEISMLQIQLPRLLGIAPFVVIAFGFFIASRSELSHAARSWLIFFGVLCIILAVALDLFFILRRRLVGAIPTRELESIRELDRGRLFEIRLIGGGIMLISVLLLMCFTIAPVSAAHHLGPGAIFLLAMSSWVTFGSLLVYLGSRWQFPVFLPCLLLAIVFSLLNDNHFIRTVPPRHGDRATVIASFEAWHNLVQKNFPSVPVHVLYVVATEGGGIRAAYWTGIVLGGLQDANPNFAAHLFAISGVSGGSLGATVFDALVAEPTGGRSFQEDAHQILSQDFLSPAMATMLYPDLVQRFLPFPVPYFDRARALELGWEKAWRNQMGNDRFANSFVDLWSKGSDRWVPALFLNGTSIEKGNRILISNLRVTDSFFDADDAAIKLSPNNVGATQAECNVPVSTATNMSSRDAILSAPGRFSDGTHIVAGSYFENSAATTALEIVDRIKEWCAFKKINDVDVKVIMISNNPRRPPTAPAKPGPEQGPGLTAPETHRGHFMGEFLAPINTLLNTRDARGKFAQRAIAHAQRRFKASDATPPSKEDPESMTPDIFYFSLEDKNVPLPLGWMLSRAAAQTMRSEWNFDGALAKNKSAAEEIGKTLPPPAPAL
jgi:hypothetical protein